MPCSRVDIYSLRPNVRAAGITAIRDKLCPGGCYQLKSVVIVEVQPFRPIHGLRYIRQHIKGEVTRRVLIPELRMLAPAPDVDIELAVTIAIYNARLVTATRRFCNAR